MQQQNEQKTVKSRGKTQTHKQPKQHKKGGSTMMVAGATGAVIGAAIGGAAGAVLADEQTRKKIGAQLSHVSEYASNAMENLDKNSQKFSDMRTKLADKLQADQKVPKLSQKS